MNRLLRFWIYLKPFKGMISLLFLCILISILIQIPIPLIQKEIIDFILPAKQMDRLIISVGLIIGLYGLCYCFDFFRNLLSVYVRQKVLTSVRMEMYRHLQKMPPQYYTKNQSGSLLSRVLMDVEFVQNLANDEFFLLISSLFKIVIVLAVLVNISWTLTLLCGSVLIPLVIIFALLRRAAYRSNKELMESQATLSGKIQENLVSMKLIQTESLQEYKGIQTESYCRELERVAMKRGRIGISGNFLMLLFSNLPLYGMILGFGGVMVIKGTLTLGALLAFMQYIVGLIGPVTLFFKFNLNLQAGLSALDRIFELLDTRLTIPDRSTAKTLNSAITTISFENIDLFYTDQHTLQKKLQALRSISFSIHKGDIVGIVGPSGSGKTSLVNLLLRFYTPDSGRLIVNGKPADSFTVKSIRDRIAYIPQEEYLFNDTIRNNLELGRPLSEKELNIALKHAQVHDFVHSLKQGLDTIIGEKGATLSGGERQRIILARAFLKQPDLYIFDEAFSALDAAASASIMDILPGYLKGKTALIVSHQFSILELADRIIVLDEGRIVQDGTFDTLKKTRGVFHYLYSLQKIKT